MELIEIDAEIRTKTGNGPARALRREGKIPAVLYGPGMESVLLAVTVSDLERALKQGSIGRMLFKLIVENGTKKTRSVMIKELQTNPVSRNFLHVDFYEIAMDRKVSALVPVVTVGESKGVQLGGHLQMVSHEVEVLCLPGEIPEFFEVDISDLDIGDSISVKDLLLKGNIEISSEANHTILTITSPKAEEEALEEEEEAEEADIGEETAEPEVEE